MLILFAFASMLCDHLGYIFFPHDVWFRLVGRLAMPIFAGMVGRNLVFTRDADRYSARLLALAVVSQPVFVAAFGVGWGALNVGFTLLAGVQLVKPFRRLQVCRVLALVPLFFSDYGFAGAAVVVSVYWLSRSGWSDLFAWIASVLAVVLLNPLIVAPVALSGLAILAAFSVGTFAAVDRSVSLRLPRLAAYGFYPVHLAFLAGIFAVVSG